MRALLCPASLKGVLSARDAAAALADGVRSAGGDAVELPVADGGEGTAESLHAALGGEWREAVVSDPLGRPVSARWLLLPDGGAVVEAAAAIGLPLLAARERDPLVTSSRGLGELVLAALRDGAGSLLVGLGGSATVDGGAGLCEVLRELAVPTTVLCDVRTTLGDAARLFGPQKGASPAEVTVLAAGLRRWAAVVAEAIGTDWSQAPGAGAAGGVGFAALAVLGATRRPGIELVLDLAGFETALDGADLVITGEGSLDVQSLAGKTPVGVARAAARRGIAVVAVAGRSTLREAELAAAGIAAVYPLTDLEPDLERCRAEADRLLRRTGQMIARDRLAEVATGA